MKQLPIKRILLATDVSGCAEQALDYACFLGKASPAEVDILHVVEVPPDLHPDDALAERYFDVHRKQAEKAAGRVGPDADFHGGGGAVAAATGHSESADQPGRGGTGRGPRHPGGARAYRIGRHLVGSTAQRVV